MPWHRFEPAGETPQLAKSKSRAVKPPCDLNRKQKVGEIRLPPSISATSTFLLVMFAEPMFPHPLLLTCRYHCV